MLKKIISTSTSEYEYAYRELKSAENELFWNLWQKYGVPNQISIKEYEKLFLEKNPSVQDVAKLFTNTKYYIPICKNKDTSKRNYSIDIKTKDNPSGTIEIPKANNLTGISFGDKSAEVLKLQKLLSLVGANYGPRFKYDGDYGNNTLGAILCLKYYLVHKCGVEAKTIGYTDTSTYENMKKAAVLNKEFVSYLERALQKEKINDKTLFVLPSIYEVPDGAKDVYEMLNEVKTEEKLSFIPEHYHAVLKHESGASHFFKLDISEFKLDLNKDNINESVVPFVIFGMDWIGKSKNQKYSYAARVNFKPGQEQEPWRNSTGWGITQYTTFDWAWPKIGTSYIYSVKENLRFGAKIFMEKLAVAKQLIDNNSKNSKYLMTQLAQKNNLPTDIQTLYSLCAIWCYNGFVYPTGYNYAENIVKTYLKKK